MRNPLALLLEFQAAEVASEGHNGWGNTMADGAKEIDRLNAEIDRLLVLATKHCDKNHHDWAEILRIAKASNASNEPTPLRGGRLE